MPKPVKVAGYRGDLAIIPPRLRVLEALEAGDVLRVERYEGWPRYEMKDGRLVQAVMDTLRINGLAQVGTDPPSLTEAGRAALAAARAAAEG